MQDKKVIVFGGSGFLGSYVVDELAKRGYNVTIADIYEPRHDTRHNAFVHCDITDPSAIEETITQDTDIVYNFAGLADLNDAIKMPVTTFQLNVMGNINILEACKKRGVERFVYASSAYAFSKKGSFYGISKHTSEKIIEEYFSRYGLEYTIVRYGSLYGERADHHNGIYKILKAALEDGKIVHKGDGEEVREYIHASDAARLSVDILEDRRYINEHIILTGVERLKMRDLLYMIKEILDDRVEIEFNAKEYKGHYRVTPYHFHPNLAKKLVTNPFIDLGQGLVDCIRNINDEITRDNEIR